MPIGLFARLAALMRVVTILLCASAPDAMNSASSGPRMNRPVVPTMRASRIVRGSFSPGAARSARVNRRAGLLRRRAGSGLEVAVDRLAEAAAIAQLRAAAQPNGPVAVRPGPDFADAVEANDQRAVDSG